MKKPLLCFLLLASIKNFSQTFTLTQAANEPVIGDVQQTYLLDTSAYVSGLNVASTGAGHVWTYTNLVTTTGTSSSTYLDPSTVPSSTNYPGCTIVQKTGQLYSYYKAVSSPSTQLEFLGISSSSLNMTFTNSALYARYPFAFSDNATDNFSGSFTFSVSGTANGNATLTADGTGTLNLPNDTLTDVLRIKSSQNTNFSAGIISGSMKMTSYDFYHASQKFPVLTIQYQTLSIAFQSPTVTVLVRGNQNNFVIGLKETSLPVLQMKLYPNPAGDFLSIESELDLKGSHVNIYNQLSQLVYSKEISDKMDISGLQKGVYLVEVVYEKGTFRKKIIKA